MKINYTFVVLLLLGSTSLLMAQDSKYKLIIPFDNEAFKERLKDYNSLSIDSLKQKKEVVVLKGKNKYAMKWFKVHEEDMAKMPTMSIKNDEHFTMRIKKYELQQPDGRSRKMNPILKDKKLPEPMNKTE